MADLKDRIAQLLVGEPVDEKKMFGGLCFLHRGNMLCGITKQGELMVRMGKELEPVARDTLPGGRDMDFTGKKMGGMLFVDAQAVETDAGLKAWLDLCLQHARTLPSK
ncbi:MAG: TfoX/Sxy family protein [Myxococcota bacterium]